MKQVVVLLLSAFFLIGCLSGYHIPREQNEEKIAAAMEVIGDRTVVVTDIQGREIRLDSVKLRSEGVLGTTRDSGVRVGYHRDSIKQIDVWGNGQKWQIINGMLIGALFGAALGALAVGDNQGYCTLPPTFIAVSAGGFSLLGGLVGAIPRQYRYRFEDTRPAIAEKETQPTPEEPRSGLLLLQLRSLSDETSDAVCIMWNGRPVWLPRSEVKIERDGEYILLTVPEKLLTEE